MDEDFLDHQGAAFGIINQVAATAKIPLRKVNIHSSDVFYRSTPAFPRIASDNNCVAVEMESFALFANAKHLNKMAATLLTISDIIPTRESITADQRERSLETMTVIALESAVALRQ